MSHEPTILLTGASGYIGGRLLPMLQARGLRVRCLSRRPEFLRARAAPGREIVAGDVMERPTLDAALAGVHTAYYLVHSMSAPGRFDDKDRLGAMNFAKAACAAGVTRIIYLGGLGESDSALSTHLQSRQEVGEVLRRHAGATQVVEFRASIVIGFGSVSFEMIRALVERLPVMITPRWVSVLAQPIAIDDVLAYLTAGLRSASRRAQNIRDRWTRCRLLSGHHARVRPPTGPDAASMIPVPVLTPRLSSLWLGLVTPLYARVGRQLIDSLRHPTVVHDDTALRTFRRAAPGHGRRHRPRPQQRGPRTRASPPGRTRFRLRASRRQWGGTRFGNRLVDSRSVRVSGDPERAFAPVLRLGGRQRLVLRQLAVAAAGMARPAGRRGRVAPRAGGTPSTWCPGDVLDCWRVEACDPPNRLLLVAEMKLPGRAWLEFEVTPDGTGSVIRQTAVFDPVGLLGLAYWYLAYPLHQLVFAGMLSGIARSARRP